MITQAQLSTLTGRDVHDRDGDKIGTVGQVWADAAGQPAWASVDTGLFGMNESLVPLRDADVTGDRVVVPFDKATVKDAPNVDASEDEPLSGDEVDRLYTHYGLSWDDSYRADRTGAADARTGYDAAGRGTDDAMTRSEERLTVGTESHAAGRARLRKYVVTEREEVTVPVSREEVRLEREPITDANAGDALSGPDISESEHEVTLLAERAVVETEAVPVERVRLGKETVTEQQTVSGEVRKERIEADLPGRGRHDLD